mmetsp:Transcript_14525/g.45763  ORF Transcript_14525/g.45763 Transcript_14525/m.45763 type:complete len:265 (+) Transcript_14525:522-1316(+)
MLQDQIGTLNAMSCSTTLVASSFMKSSSLPQKRVIATGCLHEPAGSTCFISSLQACMWKRRTPLRTTTRSRKPARTRSTWLKPSLAPRPGFRRAAGRGPRGSSGTSSSLLSASPPSSAEPSELGSWPESSCGLRATARLELSSSDAAAGAPPASTAASSQRCCQAVRSTMKVMNVSNAANSTTMVLSPACQFSSTPKKVPTRAAGTTILQTLMSITCSLGRACGPMARRTFTSSEATEPKKTIALERGTALRGESWPATMSTAT